MMIADDSCWDEVGSLGWEKALGRRQEDRLIAEYTVIMRLCARIPVKFGNTRGDCETCIVGARCMVRLPDPVTLQRYPVEYSYTTYKIEKRGPSSAIAARSWRNERL